MDVKLQLNGQRVNVDMLQLMNASNVVLVDIGQEIVLKVEVVVEDPLVVQEGPALGQDQGQEEEIDQGQGQEGHLQDQDQDQEEEIGQGQDLMIEKEIDQLQEREEEINLVLHLVLAQEHQQDLQAQEENVLSQEKDLVPLEKKAMLLQKNNFFVPFNDSNKY